jgi:HK97 family phage major capsid protein
MSKRLLGLRDEKASIMDRMEALLELADKSETGDFTEEQQADYEQMEKDLKILNTRIKREEEFLDNERSMTPVNDRNRAAVEREAGGNGGENVNVTKHNADDDPQRGFKTHREFLVSVMAAAQNPARMDSRLKPLSVEATAGSDEQSTLSDSHGGFTIPEGFLPGVKSVGDDMDPTASRVANIPMQQLKVNMLAKVDKNHSTSVSGGLTVSRRPETQAPSSSRFEIEKVALNATSLFGLAYASEELLRYSPISFAAMLADGFDMEFASKVLKERISGTGVDEPEGILNCPATISVAKESGQSADTIVALNILKMRSRCWNYSNAIWIANHDTFLQLVGLHTESTTPAGVITYYHQSFAEDRPDTMLGRPIFYNEYAKTLGDLGDLILADWSQYMWGTLQGTKSAESVHVRFENHERTFKFWQMNDGRSAWRSALTPVNSTTTLSPFITLAERA